MNSLHVGINHASLGWVKPELDKTFHQVRIEIDTFAQQPSNKDPARRCADYFHQVQGTLRMLELYAAAMVGEELELLSLGLVDGTIKAIDDASAVLMRGTVLLPDYLERIQSGHRDIPIVLLPFLNEIRALRHQPGLHESALAELNPSSSNASAEEIEHARASLSGHNRELLDTVAAVVKEELMRIKDALDLHLRTGSGPDQLQPQLKELTSVADTLGMMGLKQAREVILQQRDQLKEVVERQGRVDEDLLLHVAGALLQVDSSLDDQVANLGSVSDQSNDPLLRTAESRQTLDALSSEAIVNFGSAREHLIAFIETNWDHAQLADMPDLFDEIIGALQILDLSEPVDCLRGIREYVQHELIDQFQIPKESQLDTLAEAMASLEYYLEALRERQPGRDNILTITRNSLEALGYWPLPMHAQKAAPSDSQAQTPQPTETQPVHSEQTVAKKASDHDDTVVTAAQAGELASATVVSSAAHDEQAEESHQANASTPPASQSEKHPDPVSAPLAEESNLGGFETEGHDIDDDIREVFLEEFQEELENLSHLLPTWISAPTKIDNLRSIRRIFHTLKGSGRLVGARTLGEFAWKIENMLNRVLEGARPPSEAVIAMVRLSCDVLAQIQSVLHGRGRISMNIPAIESVIDKISLGEDAFYVPSDESAAVPEVAMEQGVHAEVLNEEVVPTEPSPIDHRADDRIITAEHPSEQPVDHPLIDEPSGTPVRIDSVLLEILQAEIKTHLDVLHHWLDGAQGGSQRVHEGILRAVHTMNGAFAMAYVPEINAVTGPLESYVKRALAADAVLQAEESGLISEAAAAIKTTTEALRRPEPRVPSFATLSDRLHHLVKTLPDAQWPPQEIAEESQAPMEPEEEVSSASHSSTDSASQHAVDSDDHLDSYSIQADSIQAQAAIDHAASAEEIASGQETAQRDEQHHALSSAIQSPPAQSSATPRQETIGSSHADSLQSPESTDIDPMQQALEAAIAVLSPALTQPLPQLGQLQSQEIDLDLVDIFVEEGRDLLDQCDTLLDALRQVPTHNEPLSGLQRSLHTLKGGARMAGINAIGDLGHSIESLLEAVMAGTTTLGQMDIALLERGFDCLHQLLVRTGEHSVVARPNALIRVFEARTEGLTDVVRSISVDSDQAHDAEIPFAPQTSKPSEPTQAATPPAVELEPTPAPASTSAEIQTSDAAQSVDQESSSAVATPSSPIAIPALSAAALALGPLSPPIPDEPVFDEDAPLARPSSQEQVRVRAELLDSLVNSAGEVAIYRSRLEQQLGAFHSAMAELDRTNTRLRDQLRRLDLETEAQIVARYQRENDQPARDFDPLELDRFSTLQQLSRGLNESAADLAGLQGVLEEMSRQYDNLLQQQSRVSSELQDGLMHARMVPFDTVVPRLRRVVRQACTETGKRAQLVVEGAHSELDRHVLDHMIAPIEHMIRNSVAHGLETPEQRRQLNKVEEGIIAIRLRYEGSEIVIEVADNGAGLNRDAILKRAQNRGLIDAQAKLTDQQIYELIFAQGLSTTDKVSQLAGRGVGMDVVRNEVGQLGGTVETQSQPGEGVVFILRLPQALAVTQAVFVRISETIYAVPVGSVGGIGRIAPDRYNAKDAGYRYAGDSYDLYDLGTLVGQSAVVPDNETPLPLLLVRAGELRAAVAIDEVLGSREVVVKPAGLQVTSIPGIYGATITGDGRVIVILDLAPLVRRHLTQPIQHQQHAPEAEREAPLVMVVDDSLTMRKVTTRVLERNNFEVVTARDGLEALELLEERVPDLMLLDIEMPRMDGYELATKMRQSARFKSVPIVMITSRSGDKHRQRALEIGVQRYLGKPYQELDLLRNVYDLLGIARVRK